MIQIKKEFKELIPSLTADEFKQLEDNCLEEGIREKIITWKGYIIDGHNRYEIAQKWNLDYETEEKHFNNETEVKIWMAYNQLGRRNLTDFVKGELYSVIEELLKEKGRLEKSKGGGDKKSDLSIIDKSDIKDEDERHNTRKEVAEKLGWSTGKKGMFDVVKKKAPEEVKEKLRIGEVSINQAYQEIKKAEKKAELEERREKIEEGVFDVDINTIPEKFEVIYADPPWRYDFSETDNRKIENHYTTMDNSDIAKMKVPAAENCVLFMWATAPKLIEAIEVLKGWGFEYKTHAIWDKEKMGMGYWFRGQHEILMVGVKGKVSPPEASIRISSVIKETRGKHSRKPDCIAEYIELAFYDKSKIELFCREPRKGWYSYGNQIENEPL